MNPIIEAAAKARWIYIYGPDEPWDTQPAGVQRRELFAMRAALRAMAEREPTVAVHEAIRNAMVDTQFSSHPLATGLAVWRALLLAVAAEEE